ncbi:hypothetical protein BDQ17DRAFT_1409044 [Cyathus striatus]|nr:hypothetical protein BDQ17DRAFT_1409044 [Cyathus striatus]
MTPKVWLVTGSSSGLGLSVVKHVLSKEDIVVATLRKPEALSDFSSKYGSSQLLIVKLDVSKPEEIISAFATAHDKFVNFWGAANVSREAIRFFRDVNKPSGGRLIQASSVSGVLGTPTCGYYSATKFGNVSLVGLSEAIAKEVDSSSYRSFVVILDLGPFKTRALDHGVLTIIPPHPNYENTTSAMRSFVTGDQASMGDSDKAGREIRRISSEDVPLHVSLGLDAIEAAKGKIELLKDNVEKSVIYSADLN